MPFNVENFRSFMKDDGARPNLFECRMTTTGLGLPNIDEDLSFFARAAQIPESQVNVIPLFYFGREIKVAGNRNFAELTLTVINDETFKIRNVMEQWMSGLNSHVGNLRRNQYGRVGGGSGSNSYTADLKLVQFGKEGDDIKSYNFIGAWPTNVSPIELDWSANDQIEEFQITLAYQWWESNTTDSSGTAPSTSTSAAGASIIG